MTATETLPESELGSIRVELEKTLPETAVISARTVTSDGGGGGSVVWAPAGTADARISPLAATEVDVADRVAEDSRWVVTLPYGTTVEQTNRIDLAGETYEVNGILDPRSHELCVRVFVGEVS